MTDSSRNSPLYPKSHLLAASGIAALLSLTLLIFPSSQVEAKKTLLSLDVESSASLSIDKDNDVLPAALVTTTADQSTQPSAGANQPASAAEAPRESLITVSRGDTLSSVFAKAALPADTLHTLLASNKEAKQLTHIKPGQVIQITRNAQGELESMSSRLSRLESVHVTRTAKGFSVKRELLKPSIRQSYARGTIDSSLFVATKRAGLSHKLALDLANIFGYDIDFALDIREGDEFEVVYEEKVVDGKVAGSGNLLAARFTNRGKTYTAVRHTDRQGNSTYYRADGSSMRKAFIRTPVDFARISSRFTNARRHPVLNKIRAHKGVDYAARPGTPIKATGDGKIILAGRKGGYGNTVVIQHGQRYRTLYAHMKGFAKGIRNGSQVTQGQIIGYVGTTGLSTGPHLHYEFQVNGTHVDPLSQKLPMADPIAGAERKRFLQQSQPLLARMDQERTSLLALNKR
ncbi:Murein DD-endopeptidase MepM and murein hydrolase activator NlpD, contain LysM domain [Pseudomonas linyingensis]|uniref:Murein DD-endopeptidase MepM and murein hydrolase activator NlpD, contain LysM domain n=1 Tax=Pseudomonas linyingensis TaxID=915471 RepID=A0A1H7AW28_9PSED|nr:peptidoglycan DD-metalloendopeptidase family protein [Pseudomonas linyingensis]SEJ69821.1 Murein DD-endopeptidase MepM and murein hydrolase activator NlpD, contain LysM domain [Pseudomonas linyingensis]